MKRPPAYSGPQKSPSPVRRAGDSLAQLRGKTLHVTSANGAVALSFKAACAVRAAEGALITAGLLKPSSMMRTRFLGEIVELCCAGVPLDDPSLVRLWRYD